MRVRRGRRQLDVSDESALLRMPQTRCASRETEAQQKGKRVCVCECVCVIHKECNKY